MQNENPVFDMFRALIVAMKDIELSNIKPGSSFKELALDSLDFVELQIQSQKNYGVDLPPELFESMKITTLQQLSDYITQRTPSAH